jgi:hypothetical protein
MITKLLLIFVFGLFNQCSSNAVADFSPMITDHFFQLINAPLHKEISKVMMEMMIDPEPIVLPNMPIRDLIIDITVFDVKSIQFDVLSGFSYENRILKYWAKLNSDIHIDYKLNRYEVDFL